MTDRVGELERELHLLRQQKRQLQEELNETNRGLVALTLELEDRVDKRTAQLQRHAEQQAAVARLGQIALASRGVDLVRRQAVEAVTRILEMDHGLLFEYAAKEESLVLAATAGKPVPCRAGDDAPCLPGWRLEDFEDLHDVHDRLLASEPLQALQAESGMSVLIGAHHEPFGILALYSGDERLVSQDDRVFLESMANIVASAWARELAEDARARFLKELERSNDELKQFAYVASHDLQEPLRTVGSFVQLLARRYRGKLDQDADDFIGFTVDGVTRMRGLINDLLRYSRVGTSTGPFEEVQSREALDRAMANLQAALDESEAEVHCGDLPPVRADRGQLVQLFQNMLGNALKFRGEQRPRIDVTATRTDGRWQFSVSDNGIGIKPQFKETIFLIFKRLHTRDEYPGSGIGLALCKKIVDRHDGEIWIEPQDEGTTFCFTLPALDR